jgi:WD40 repeat protein
MIYLYPFVAVSYFFLKRKVCSFCSWVQIVLTFDHPNNWFASLQSFFLAVTCIQFNPVDDNFFISGSLDEKVRIWNVRDRKIEDWNDLHEMVTAACYSPDGQVEVVSF